jgi:hypothetical protein
MHRWLLLSLALAVGACRPTPPDDVRLPTGFAASVNALSEPGGFFDTDNLISNERSYLHAVTDLEGAGGAGTAYVGVGPGQNFSYIAAVNPDVAYLIDLRRDNMLLHLLYKAAFELAPTRVEYLALLFGREAPDAPGDWQDASIVELVAFVDDGVADGTAAARARARADSAVASFGVPLTDEDLSTIARFHRTFIDAGLSLRFSSFGRLPRPHYPTLRDLLLERDRDGRQVNYLSSAERYRTVRRLQRDDAVLPLVGDLAGPHALRALGDDARARDVEVSTLYVSNVEFYLFRQRTFGAYADNVASLPFADDGVVVRSIFDGGRGGFASGGVVYYSRQQVVSIGAMIAAHRRGAISGYRALVALSPALPRR